jgi:hypothetical protein
MSSLTELQRDFIPHVLQHIYPDAAAKYCGIDEHTALKWMQNPDFRRELQLARKASAQHVMFALEKYANKAVKALVDCLSEDKPDSTRIKAADSILSHTIEYRKLYGIEDRLDELEEIAGVAKKVKDGK